MDSDIQAAIRAAGRQIVKELGVSRMAIQYWVTRGVPAHRVLSVERLTGISRHRLRPDIYPEEAK